MDQNELDFLLYLLPSTVPLLVFSGFVLGIVVLVAWKATPRTARIVKWLGSSVIAAATVFYIWFMSLWLSHLDTPNLIAAPPEEKLAEWTHACETSLRVGTSLQEVEAHVEGLGFRAPGSKQPWRGESYYHRYRKNEWVHYQLFDKDVRNWGTFGDIDIETTVNLHDDIVSSCGTRIFKHGR